jgi:orotate phosphoribosyltransferase
VNNPKISYANISAVIQTFLKTNGGIYDDAIIVLKSRKISNFYVNARLLNEKNEETGEYTHEPFLKYVGGAIGGHAERLQANMLIGVITTGATLAKFAEQVSGIKARYINPHDENPAPDGDISGKKVFIVDDVTTTGGSIRDAVAVCEAAGAEVVGALTLVRRDPDKVRETEVGLDPTKQTFISLLDIDMEIKVEEVSDESELLKSGLPIRLNIGYAAHDNWPEKYAQYAYIGEPNQKG